jgi:hypothetical protein
MFDDTKGINNITRWLCSVTMENHNFILIIRDKSSKNIYKWAIYTMAPKTPNSSQKNPIRSQQHCRMGHPWAPKIAKLPKRVVNYGLC